jgi:hypothetical protein
MHAIAKTVINQAVIDIEWCDQHEIEAFVKSFNFMSKEKLSLIFNFKIFLKFP